MSVVLLETELDCLSKQGGTRNGAEANGDSVGDMTSSMG